MLTPPTPCPKPKAQIPNPNAQMPKCPNADLPKCPMLERPGQGCRPSFHTGLHFTPGRLSFAVNTELASITYGHSLCHVWLHLTLTLALTRTLTLPLTLTLTPGLSFAVS